MRRFRASKTHTRRTSTLRSPLRWLSLRLPASPPAPARIRPTNLVYGVDDRPPLPAVLVLAIQHVTLVLALQVYVLIVAQEMGLDTAGTRALVATSVLVYGVGTILQTLRPPLGAGLLLVHMPDPLMIVSYAGIAKAAGAAAAGGALVLASLLQLALSRVVSHLRVLFPPEVLGVMVCMLGISMVGGGVHRLLGLSPSAGAVDATASVIGLLTLGSIVAVAVWSRGSLRLFALIIGLLVGGAASLAAGTLDTGGAGAAVGWFALPPLRLPSFDFPPTAFLPLGLGVILAALDTVGSVVVMERMDDAGWRRSNMRVVGGAVWVNGATNLLGGLIGGFGTGTSSANIGLCSATGATARVIGVAAGAMLVVGSCFPPLIAVITMIPEPVKGAISLYAAAYLVTSGMELILSRMLDARRTFMVGLSIAAGIAIIALPSLVAQAPAWAHEIVSSPLAVASLVAIALNLLFRLGIARSATLPIHGGTSVREVTTFLERCGADWGARRDVVLKAGNAAVEAVEVLRGSDRADGEIALTATFDEFNLDLEFVHPGKPVVLAAAAIDPHTALEGDDDDLEALLSAASNALLTRMADRARTLTRGDRSVLALHFVH